MNNPYADFLQRPGPEKEGNLKVPQTLIDRGIRVLQKNGFTIRSVSDDFLKLIEIGLNQVETGAMPSPTPPSPPVDLSQVRQRLKSIEGSARSALSLIDEPEEIDDLEDL